MAEVTAGCPPAAGSGPTLPPMNAAWAAAALTAGRAAPQLGRLVRTRDGTGGVSVAAAAVFTITYLPWAAHGAVTGEPAVLVANTAGAVIYTAIALTALRYGATRTQGWLPAGVAVAVAGAWLAGGLGAALAVTFVAPVAYGAPQLYAAATAPTVASLSPATLLLSVTEVSLWLVWAIGAGDRPMTIYMGLGVVAHAGTLAVWALRRTRTHRVR